MKKAIITLQLCLVFALIGCSNNATVIPTEKDKPLESGPLESTSPTDVPADTIWYQNMKLNIDTLWSVPIVETDTDFYYIAEDGVYQYTKDTQEEFKIIPETAYGLYLYDNDVYYNTDHQVVCMDLQTKSTSVIWDGSALLNTEDFDAHYYFSICGFMLADGHLYIAGTGTSVLCVNLENGELELFLEDCGGMIHLANNCYYLDHAARTFSLYCIACDTKERTLLRGEGYSEPGSDSMRIDGIARVEDMIFYTVRDSSEIYMYHSDGSDLQIFDSDDHFWVSFVKGYSEQKLYFYTTNGARLNLYEYQPSTNVTLLLSVDCSTHQCDLVITETAVFWWSEEESSVKCFVKE